MKNQSDRRYKADAIIEGTSIKLLSLMILTVTAGCRREIPLAHSSADSQTSVVATTSSPDSQASSIATTSSAAASAAAIAAADTAPAVHFSSAKDSLCGELAENGLKIPN